MEGPAEDGEAEGSSKRVKRALEIINQVLGKWGLTELCLSARKKGPMVNGKRGYVDSTYRLQEKKRHFEGFVKQSQM